MRVETFTLTASMLRSYKACPRKFELEYIEQLKPETSPDYFTIGRNYHSCVENIITGRPYFSEDDIVNVMAGVFERHIPWRNWKISEGGEVEKQFDIKLSRYSRLAGRIDAISAYGVPIEHKTSGVKLDEKYIRNLMFDDQVSVYLLALSLMYKKPVTEAIYTVCQKPTIKHTAKETREEYLSRVSDWYLTDTESKIGVVTVTRSIDELKEKEIEIREMIKEIRKRKHWYRNPSNCSIFECSYSSICMNYDPQVTSGFVKKERKSEELCQECPQF